MTPTTTADKVKEIYFSIAKELTGDDWDFTADYERWLTTAEGSRLVGELVEGWAVETLKEVSKLLVRYHSQIGQTGVGNHCFNVIREAVFANKAKGFPDNITDKIN